MNLYRQIIEGKTYVDIPTSGIFEHLIASTNPDVLKWEEVTSLTNIVTYINELMINSVGDLRIKQTFISSDYKAIRDVMKRFVIEIGISVAIDERNDPPVISMDGQKYLVGSNPTGDWVGHEGEIATSVFVGMSWTFQSPVDEGFDTISVNEKIICCTHNIGSHTKQVSIVGIDNLVLLGAQYSERTYKAREVRLHLSTAQVFNRLHNDKEEILGDAVSDNLLVTFLQGREGTEYGDDEGLADYINGTTGTKYANNGSLPGLRHKGFSPVGMTLDQFCDMLLGILIEGNY